MVGSVIVCLSVFQYVSVCVTVKEPWIWCCHYKTTQVLVYYGRQCHCLSVCLSVCVCLCHSERTMDLMLSLQNNVSSGLLWLTVSLSVRLSFSMSVCVTVKEPWIWCCHYKTTWVLVYYGRRCPVVSSVDLSRVLISVYSYQWLLYALDYWYVVHTHTHTHTVTVTGMFRHR